MKKVILFICFVVCVVVADAQVVNSVHQDYTKVAKDSFALVNGSLPSYKRQIFKDCFFRQWYRGKEQ